ncbi:hypothetical protein [Phormidium tenue]|uniref:Uncharacterized protein n=1 Tax=Phormidium tenue NIES-30 TaxID=549789 RepID=A0A1U7J3Z6_9CYAN|nr:hypothetical protein [Phormidium tenue]MBD2233042.1 hypothetical protein [Phormidium tenue FACHB-1052]OKH47141.1 hypothetical protein NIES30_14280 [Phormidium tenue NIES-30]
MKPNSLYAQLELIQEPLGNPIQTDYSIARVWAGAKRYLRRAGGALLTYLCGSTDLSVTVKRDLRGNTLFVAYDPVSQQRRTFSSEQELRVWADQRYYQ